MPFKIIKCIYLAGPQKKKKTNFNSFLFVQIKVVFLTYTTIMTLKYAVYILLSFVSLSWVLYSLAEFFFFFWLTLKYKGIEM